MSPKRPSLRFHEVQRFRQVLVWVLLGFIALLVWHNFIQQILLGAPMGSNPASDGVLVVLWVVFGIGFPVWFYLMKLETRVSDGVLCFRFFPLHPRWKKIPADQIAGAMAITFRPFREYGGWGIRLGRRGIAYTVSGDRGVIIRLKSGKSFVLGSQRAEELEVILRKMMEPGIDRPVEKTEIKLNYI
jgi:hypothetical protein